MKDVNAEQERHRSDNEETFSSPTNSQPVHEYHKYHKYHIGVYVQL